MFTKVLPNIISSFFLLIVVILAISYYFNLSNISEDAGYLSIFIIGLIGVISSLMSYFIIFFLNNDFKISSSTNDIDDSDRDLTGYSENTVNRLNEPPVVQNRSRSNSGTKFGGSFRAITPRTPRNAGIPNPGTGFSTPEDGIVYDIGGSPPTDSRPIMKPFSEYDSITTGYGSQTLTFPPTDDDRRIVVEQSRRFA